MSIPKDEVGAIKSDASKVPVEPGKGCTLGVGTYLFPVSSPDSPTESVQLIWDAAIVATSIVFQDCNAPRFKKPNDPDSGDDITDIDLTAGKWMTEDPSTAYVPIAGAGATVVNMTIALAGGAVGGAMLNLGNLGSKRGRIKVVTTTGGALRVLPHGKSG